MTKTLIAYFSHTGENYFGGNIRAIEKGNTAVVAEKIQALTGGELFEIKTHDYPYVYRECTDLAQVEKQQKARPELRAWPQNLEDVETIILGYPNWWGDMPMAVYTFLEGVDLSGKTIYPYCTHEGSGLSQTVSTLRRLLPQAIVKEGLAIQGSRVQQDDRVLAEWLKNI